MIPFFFVYFLSLIHWYYQFSYLNIFKIDSCKGGPFIFKNKHSGPQNTASDLWGFLLLIVYTLRNIYAKFQLVTNFYKVFA